MGNFNKIIIVISLFSLSVYNYTMNYIRPTDLFIPLVLIILLKRRTLLRYELLLSLITLSYLLVIYLFNVNEIDWWGLHYLIVYWGYFFIFLLLSKIFIWIDIKQYKKFILKTLLISISLILIIYTLNYFHFKPTLILFGGQNSKSILLIDSINNSRVSGVAISIYFLAIIIFYIYNVKIKYHLFLIFSYILLFYYNSSRQTLITFILLYVFLFVKLRYIRIGVIILLVSYTTLFSFAYTLSKTENPIAMRIAELIHFYNSPSSFVRENDVKQTLSQLRDKSKLLWGIGASGKVELTKYSTELDFETGELKKKEHKFVNKQHGGDNSFVLSVIDGGLFFLFLIIITIYITYKRINVFDKKLSYAFIIIILVNGMTSKHLITNYVLSFILGFILFYSIYETKKRQSILLIE